MIPGVLCVATLEETRGVSPAVCLRAGEVDRFWEINRGDLGSGNLLWGFRVSATDRLLGAEDPCWAASNQLYSSRCGGMDSLYGEDGEVNAICS